MGILLFLHLVCAAVWLGCILVEAVIEHSITPTAEMRDFISKAHWTIDKAIEIPAFLGVLATGTLMLGGVAMTPLLWTKAGFGLVAILFNALCVGLVAKRLGFARAGDFAGWERVDRRQHRLGGVVLLALVAALVLGGIAFAEK